MSKKQKNENLQFLNSDLIKNSSKFEKNEKLEKIDKNEKIDGLKVFLFGSIAASCAKTVIAPLDRAKIMIQISSHEFTFKKVNEILKFTIKYNGISGMWKGHSATLCRVIPYGGIQFFTHEKCKFYFLNKKNFQNLNSYFIKELDIKERIICGCITGIISTFTTYPLDLIRTRMAVSKNYQFNKITKTFIITIKNEGIFGLYRGIFPSLIGIIPYAGSSFMTFETLKSNICYYKKNPNYKLSIIEKLICGGFAGLIAQSFSYPFDIIRRIMQSDCLSNKSQYTFIKSINVIQHVLNTNGFIKGFYKGLSLNWIKGPIATATSFTVFETLKQYFI